MVDMEEMLLVPKVGLLEDIVSLLVTRSHTFKKVVGRSVLIGFGIRKYG